MGKKYKQEKMVNWFEPGMLAQTAIKAIVSSAFGNYADKREIEAALHESTIEEKEADQVNKEYSEKDEIWLDYISDTGDGFNSTYSVAHLVAQPFLEVKINGVEKKIERGKILVFGGDQIYPTPTMEMYENKFRIPFRAAFPYTEMKDHPHLYAIPGNHDWYDGLNNFIKLFCQKRWIGNWITKQHRSYFALQLPHGHWIWATDIQLNSDIDKPQLDYFLHIAKNKMKDGDKVILFTAEPAWVYKQMYKGNKSFEKLDYFTQVYITEDKYNWVGKKFKLVATITGDLHHYSRYCDSNEDHQYITAGGGGAFMHLTHNLPKQLPKLPYENISQQVIFPSEKQSKCLSWWNLAFPALNWQFAALLSGLYTILLWVLQSNSLDVFPYRFLEVIQHNSFGDFIRNSLRAIMGIPSITILSLVFFLGIFVFTDKKSGRKGLGILGFAHALIQLFMMFFLFRIAAKVFTSHLVWNLSNFGWDLGILLFVGVIGGGIGACIMGIYIFLTNRLFNIHIDEASISFSHAGYKNFLRIHVQKESITIYPIGIKKETKNWNQSGSGDGLRFEGKTPEYSLIENPIIIKK